MANAIAKLLALQLSNQDHVEIIKASGLPAFVKDDRVLGFLRDLAPTGTVLDALKVATTFDLKALEPASPVVSALCSALPAHRDVIEGAVLAYVSEPDAFHKQVEDRAVSAVSSLVTRKVNPSTLRRCPVCTLPFTTDGSTGCPHC